MYSPIIGPSSSFPCSVLSTSSARSLTGYGPCLPCQPYLPMLKSHAQSSQLSKLLEPLSTSNSDTIFPSLYLQSDTHSRSSASTFPPCRGKSMPLHCIASHLCLPSTRCERVISASAPISSLLSTPLSQAIWLLSPARDKRLQACLVEHLVE